MALTLAQAAEATGRDRSTILRGIKRGTISAVRDERTQAWMVEPAELHRVFPPMQAHQPAQAAAQAHNGTDSLYTRLAVAEAEVRLKDEIIAELRRSIALLTDQRSQSPVTVPLPVTVPSPVSDSPAPARRHRGWRFWR